MPLLANSPALAYALIAAVAAAIVLLHLLKPRPRQMLVASTLLWASVAKRYRRRDRLWRWWLSLALCLAVGLAIALALIRSDAPGMTTGARMVLVLDNSPSMAARTRDGKTRWSHAIERSRSLIEANAAQVMLLDTMGGAPVSGYVSREEAQAAVGRIRVAIDGVAQMPTVPDMASAQLHIVSDGVASLNIPERAVVHSVFEPADNVAVTALEVRPFPADPLRYEAFVQVYNASLVPKHARVTLRGGERFALSQELDLAPGELVDAAFDVSGFEGGVLAAGALSGNDAFALDDVAFAVVPAHRAKQVVLITQGNARLEDCLRSLAGVRVRTLTPAAYRDDLQADAYVFDGFAPSKAPSVGALLFQPSAVSWLPAPAGEVNNATVAKWDRTHPLADGVAWHDLRIKHATLRSAVSERTVVSTANGALIATGQAAAPWIIVGFAPQASNLALQPGFPIFVGNALAWLGDVDPSAARSIGTVHVPLINGYVVDGGGARIASRATPNGTVFEALRPDVYTVHAGARQLKVVANLLDPRVADINHSRFVDRPPSIGQQPAGLRRPAEPWMLLLLIATAFLLIEWAAYTRRVTV